jgi:geranylgeranyl pyrophosphate synthase
MNEIENLRACILALPEVAAWPEMAGLFERYEGTAHSDWRLPGMACRAVGGDVAAAIPGAAALACMQISIILVDDMLDDDPRGAHLRLGPGPAANLAVALQAAAIRLVEQAPVSAERRAAAAASLAGMALTTALGQQWDAQNLAGEENYWKVVRAKSTPFYAAALHVGALLGGAETGVAEGVRDFGALIGEVIQIQDDVLDAFQTPANPDWKQGRNNLLLLYALTAQHPARTQFMELLARIDDPSALAEAQRILIRCGAASYAVYQLIQRYRAARERLARLPLADPAPMQELLARQTRPLADLLRSIGADVPEELLLQSRA